jgi:hypothetical protein
MVPGMARPARLWRRSHQRPKGIQKATAVSR